VTTASATFRAATLPAEDAAPARGPRREALRRLLRHRMAAASLVVLLAIGTLAALGSRVPAVQRYDPRYDQDYDAVQQGPSVDHFFGTDNLGRDTWSRVLHGTLTSLTVGLGVQAIVLVLGLAAGSLAVLGGRWWDHVVMRLTDLAYAFPDLLAIILLSNVFRGRDLSLLGNEASHVALVIAAIAFVNWVTVARLVRGQLLSLREEEFVVAARALGASEARIVFRHLLPHAMGPVIVTLVFGVPLAIFAEAALSFLGLGLPPPSPSLGSLIDEGNEFAATNAWMLVFPAGMVALLMLCFTFLGDGLRDALDPRSR